MKAAEFQADNPYASFGMTVDKAPADERVAFVRRTYVHLAGAVYAFAALEWVIFSTGLIDSIMPLLGGAGMLLNFVGFLVVSWLAERWAQSETSAAKQYAGLGVYVVAMAIFSAPLLWLASHYELPIAGVGVLGVIPVAGVTTLIMFAGLTAVAWLSGADFSFLRAGLGLGITAAIALCVASAFGLVSLGVWFSAGMVILMCGYILYYTSNVMHHYRPTQHVAAALALFASVALLFLYLVQLLMAFSRD